MAETFPSMLKRLRRERGLTAWRLGRRAFVGHSYVTQLERGIHTRPSRELVASLASALELGGVDTARLLIAAGLWPWHMDDASITAFVEAVEEASAMGAEDAEPVAMRSRAG